MKLNHSFLLNYCLLFDFLILILAFLLQDFSIYWLIRVLNVFLRHKHANFARWGRWGRRGRLRNRVHHDLTQPNLHHENISTFLLSLFIITYYWNHLCISLYSIFYRRHLYLIYRYLLDFNFFSSFFENLKLHLFGIV